MADKRISQLVDRGTVVNNDVIPIVVSGATTTNKATISSIQTFMQGNLDVGVTSVGITLGSTGTDVNVSGSPVTSSGNITINIPSASATNRGLVTTGAQTFAGAKTTTSNINVNGVYVGRGASGGDLFAGIAGNTAVGTQALLSITTGYPNTALGSEALRNITTGANNIAIGSEAGKIDSGSSTANATSSSSIYIGDNTKPQTNGNTNEIVIGHATSGNGSNTVTIGNSSTTFNKFFGATQSDTFRLPSDGGGNQVTVFENIGTIHQGTASLNNFGFNNSNNIYFGKGLSNGGVIQWTNAAVRSYTLPDADGTIALTSDLSGYVTLATTQTITAQKTFTTSGSSDTMIISHGSGSGFALDVLKAGNGEAIRVTKSSGSGNAMTISGGNFEAGTIVKTGGTSAQFLKADGSVDSSTYLTTGTAASTYLPLAGGTLTGVLNGTSASFTGRARFQGTGFDTLGSAEIMLSNSTTSAGKSYIVNSSNAGEFLISDASAAQTRLSINNSGAVTLTGVLNGTSASFSGDITTTGTGFQGRYTRIYEASAQRGGLYPYNIISGAGTDYSIGLFSESSLWFAAGGGVTKHFTIASTGAATFTAATQDAIQTVVRMSGNNASSQIKALDFKLTAGTPLWTISTAATGTDAGINIMPNGNAGLSLTYAGAATFSSSVTANGNSNTFGNASLSGKAVIIQAGSTNQAIMFKNSAGGDATLFINGTSTSVDYNFNTYSVGDALVIKNNGNVGIGTASPSAKFHVFGTAKFDDPNGIILASNTQFRQIYFDGFSNLYFWNGSNQSYLSSAGTWVNASDISIKKDIKEIKYTLSDLLKLKPKSYKMVDTDLEQIGFIAQDVENIIPELVGTDNKEMKSLNYGNMVALLVKAIQEQQIQIDSLKNQIK